MGVVKGVIFNGIANIVQKVVRVLDQLLLVPFFLTQWGAEYYGEWLTLTIIPSVLAFSDLGFGSAISNSFVLAYASGDKQKSVNISASGFVLNTFSVVLGSLLTICVLLFGNNYGLFEKSYINADDAICAVSMLMFSHLIGFYNQAIEGYYRATHRAPLASLIHSSRNVLNIIVGIAVLYAGYNVVGFALSQLIVSVVCIIVYWILGRRYVDFGGCKGHVLKSDMRMLATKGLGYMMTPIWQSVYFQGGTFVVRLALGPESVAVFNTVRTACRSINQLYSIINASIFPDLQLEYGKGNMKGVHLLFRVSVLISMCLGFVGCIFLMLFGLDLYSWWTQSVLTVSNIVWYTFVLGVFFNAIWWTSVVTYRMTNQPFHFAFASVIMSLISVGVSYLLALKLGLLGAVIGTLVFEFVMMCFVLPDSCRLLGMRVSDLFSHIGDDFKLIKARFFKR